MKFFKKFVLLLFGIGLVLTLLLWLWSRFPAPRHEEQVRDAIERGSAAYQGLVDAKDPESNGWIKLQAADFFQGEELKRLLSVTSDLKTVADHRQKQKESPEIYQQAVAGFHSRTGELREALSSPDFKVQIGTLRLDQAKLDPTPYIQLDSALGSLSMSFASEAKWSNAIDMFELRFLLSRRLRTQPPMLMSMTGTALLRRQCLSLLENPVWNVELSFTEHDRIVEMTKPSERSAKQILTSALDFDLASAAELERSIVEDGDPNMHNYAGMGMYFVLPGVLEREFRIYRNIMGETLGALQQEFETIPTFFAAEETSFVKGENSLLAAILVPDVMETWSDLKTTSVLNQAVYQAARLKSVRKKTGAFPESWVVDGSAFQYEKVAADKAALTYRWKVAPTSTGLNRLQGTPGLSVDSEGLRLEVNFTPDD